MQPFVRILICLLLLVPALSSQEKSDPETPAAQDQPAQYESSPATDEPAHSGAAPQKQPAQPQTAPPAEPPPDADQPKGPRPTEIIAHETSVTDMLDVIPFESKIFGNNRMVRVFLPGNYFSPHNALRKYPVLYLQDGQNVFDKATSFRQMEWEADETVDHLVGQFKIHPMFVIGIDNAGERRTSEYLAYPDPHNPQFQGANPPVLEGTKYADFLTKELMPYLQKRYRIATGPANTAIGGSSYGADISLLTALNRPGVFGKLLLESPSLYVGDGQLLTDTEKAKLLPLQIYLGVGTKESGDAGSDAQIVQQVKDLEAILQKKGLGPARLKMAVEEGAEHNENAWARRLPDALLFFYGAAPPKTTDKAVRKTASKR
jgi:predicted alpha/beta superfamily hydrolase